jgi:hypothetical protein
MYRGYDPLRASLLTPPPAIALFITGPPGEFLPEKYIVF